MSYAQLLLEEGINAQFLAVIRPRTIVEGFIVFSGSVYVADDFTLGMVSAVSFNGESLTENTSTSLAAGEWYYDDDFNKLYVRTSGGVDPDTGTLVVTYELYVGTFDAHWHQDPVDENSKAVYFNPIIAKSPEIKQSTGDSTFGYMPVQSSTIVLNNGLHELEEHLHYSSFNRAEVLLYHWLDELAAVNIKLVFKGLIDKVSYDTDRVTFSLFSQLNDLNFEFRNDDESFYTTALFPDLDPNFVEKPIRYVYGVVDNFKPVNVSYLEESPTTSDNRSWAVIGEQNLSDFSSTVPASPASTTTRTYLTSASGLRVGDSVWLDGATDYYVIVTAVNYTSNYIEHDAIAAPMATGEFAKSSFVGNLFIIQDNVIYQPLFGRDYTSDYAMAGGVSGFTLSTSLEANLSMPATLSTRDTVFCRVYGRENDVTVGGGPLGLDSESTGNLATPVPIIVDLLKRVAEIPDDDLDPATFIAADSVRPEVLGISIPESADSSSFPNVKELIAQIIQTSLLKVYFDSDLKYAAFATAPTSLADYTIDETEIIDGSFNYDYDQKDLVNRVVVRFARKEVQSQQDTFTETYSTKTVSDNVVAYLHDVDSSHTVDTFLVEEADAELLATRLLFYLGEPMGRVKLQTKNRFFNVNIGDVIELNRVKLPGFPYDEDVSNSRKFRVIGVSKSLKLVTIDLDDQKGIEDNNLSW